MIIDNSRGGYGHVAVAPSRESAAMTFGRSDPELFVTTYNDLDREVDLSQLVALDLVLDAAAIPLLEWALERLDAGGPSLRVAVQPGTAVDLKARLDNAGVTIARVEGTNGAALLHLTTRGGTDTTATGLVFDALDAGARLQAARARLPATTAAPNSRRRQQPTLLHWLNTVESWWRGPRHRLAAITVLVVLVLTLLALGSLPGSTRALLVVAMPALVVLALATLVASCYTTLRLARQLHMQTGRIERMVLRNREVVQKRTQGLTQRLGHIERTQSRLPFLEQYVEAVAEHGASTSARLRDLLEVLEVDQAVDRSRPVQ